MTDSIGAKSDVYNCLVTSPPGGVRSTVMSMSVCPSVRSNNSKTAQQNFTNFLCMLPVALALSSPSSVVPVSSVTLCLEEIAGWRYQLDVRQLQCLVEFVRMWHRGRSLLSTIALFSVLGLADRRISVHVKNCARRDCTATALSSALNCTKCCNLLQQTQ